MTTKLKRLMVVRLAALVLASSTVVALLTSGAAAYTQHDTGNERPGIRAVGNEHLHWE